MESTLNKILICILAAITLAIVLVSAVAFASKKAVPGYGLRREDPNPTKITEELKKERKSAYNEIGQIRAASKNDENDNHSVIILTPWLEYPEGDTAFYQEMDTKLRSIKSIFVSYFARYTKAELLSKGENRIKSELLDEINETLALGQAGAIYFNDYLFLN